MAEKQQMEEAQRIRAKFPGHVPVICVDPEKTSKRKLLVPDRMKGSEFASTARDRCPWAKEDSTLLLDGKELMMDSIVSDLHRDHQAPDGFLYVVLQVGAASATPKQAGAALAAEEAGAAASAGKAEPSVFHMPDHDQQQTLSADARRAKKVLKKYPDRVPVLVKQAATPGLPHIDKKLLVPRTMTCGGLKTILPKHLGIPEAAAVAWDKLQLSMGDVPLKDFSAMSDIYKQYVDEDDGGLHITLTIDMPTPAADHEDVTERAEEADELKEAEKCMAHAKLALESAEERVKAAEHAAAAEAKKAEAAEDRALAAEERALAAQEKMAHLGQAFLEESGKAEQLQDALQAAELQVQALRAEKTAQSELARSAACELLVLREQLVAARDTSSQESDSLQEKLLASEQMLKEEVHKVQVAESALEAAENEIKHQAERTTLAEQAKVAALGLAQAEATKAALHEQHQQEEIKKLQDELRLLSDRLAVESAQRVAAQQQASTLAEELAAVEKANAAKETQAMQQEEGIIMPDGFVHLGWDHDGFAAEVEADDKEFELLVSEDA